MQKYSYKIAKRRYHRVFWPLMAAYFAVVIGGSLYLNASGSDALWLKAMLGVAMGLPMAGVLFALIRFFEEADDYIRLQQLRAFAYGTAITLGAIAILGSLQMFEALGRIEIFWAVPGFFLAYGLMYCWLGAKART